MGKYIDLLNKKSYLKLSLGTVLLKDLRKT